MSRASVFAAFVERDLRKDLKSLPGVFAELFLQPILFLFVFAFVLPAVGGIDRGYLGVLVPGLAAMTAVSSGITGVCLPVLIELHYTREIDDRLAAPVPARFVALAKMTHSVIRAFLGAICFVLVAWALVGKSPFEYGPGLFLGAFLGAFVGSGIGMLLAGFVDVKNIDAVAAASVSLVGFTGCAQYSWASLSALPAFQWVTLLNPLTYASELTRAASTHSLAPALCVAVLSVLAVVTWAAGARRFGVIVAR
ncbi:ABC transporter permease [Falsarthrobacter nasiphocae]|uniref:ABC-2 type transport system permease protein n=1 Tax=Falsarthrobacter nasiphocae TaxID=189863 RepID=A0AAE4C8Y9_9MICC|nr:ABC transporter permease [Falsarthrobacter nasiphocae]MDR6892885.1 ABC-2 type transport system permease protein [Falsarthrobacter nasiphocae]